MIEDVFLGVCGFPAILRSDRGASFTGSTIAAINRIFHINHRLGAAFHPQAQGYIEARHKPINAILKAFCNSYPESWPRVFKYAQWALRATPRADRMDRSPYELVTGLKPQGLSDQIFRKLSGKSISVGGYLSTLQEYLHQVHSLVRQELEGQLAKKKQRAALHASSASSPLKVGDRVLLRRAPAAVQSAVGHSGVSRRLLPLTSNVMYEVYKLVNPGLVVLCDATTRSTDLGFSNPVL